MNAKANTFRESGDGCPEGTDENSPAFQRGDVSDAGQVPKGRLKDWEKRYPFSRPFGTHILPTALPGVETPGYYRNVPPGQTSIAFPKGTKSAARASVAGAVVLFLFSTRIIAADWPQFLGPTANGISTETGLLDKWPTNGPPLVWEKVVGTGYSAPSVRGNLLV